MDLQTIKQLIKQDRIIKFYQSPAWRSLRLRVLIRDNNECQECKRQGRVTTTHTPYPSRTLPITQGRDENKRRKINKKRSQGKFHVHHIKEVKDYPELALVITNLETLCVRCHNDVHDRLKDYQPKIKFMNEERW